jgi:predicted membrane-bound spermidine synthase
MAIHAGVFLVTFSGLLFEVALTRIFSATIWYHFAFVAVSTALLGWGLGGLLLHLLKKKVAPSLEKAALLTFAYGCSIPLCLRVIVQFPFLPERLPLYFAASLMPFLLAGMALSMVFDLRREITARLYFSDLLGASLGSLAVTFLLAWLGGEATVVAVAAAPLAAAAFFSRRFVPASIVAVVLVAAAVFFHEQTGFFKIRSAPTKGMYQHMAAVPDSRIALTGWNAYSRIDGVEGLPPPFAARLYIDSDAWTGVLRWDGRQESVRGLSDWYRALPFRFTPNAKTLVIGPGGGSDVLVALGAGSEKVTAVELNPLMFEFVRHYGDRAGNLYDHPKVEPILSEGRTFISRTDRKFDVIFLGFVDSWASVASGGLSLSENYLYTVEAFRAYVDRLTDDGMLVILRWDVDIPRLITNSIALLGAGEASRRIVAVIEKRGTPEEPPQMLFMLRKRPFTEVETAEIMERWTLARPVVVPGRHADPPYGDLLSGRKSLKQYAAEAPARVDPVFDDSPFYFATQKPWGIPVFMQYAFLFLLAPIVALLAVMVWFGRPRVGPAGPYAGSVVYFACLGLGFISIELALLQNLTLLLGHPIFTLSILLFTLLASSGLGSCVSDRFPIRRVCLAIAALGVLYAFALPMLVPELLPLGLPARIAVAVALVALPGFAMGMPFPIGLRKAGEGGLPAPPFYWGLNGVMSVVGSIATMVVALTLGFRVAMIAGSLCYLAAAAASPFLERRSPALPPGVRSAV